MSDLKNILNQDDDFNSEELIRYLEGKASEEERFAVEKQMADSAFVNDAVEGLQQFTTTGQLQQYADQLNRQLRKQTTASQRKKNRRGLKEQNWTLIAIVAILVICVLGYFVIRIFHQKQQAPHPQQPTQPVSRH